MLTGLAQRIAHLMWARLSSAGMITADTPAGRRFAHFGDGSLIAFPYGSICGEPGISIGDGTLIAPLATISAGMFHQRDFGPEPVLSIGDRCVIGRGSHIVAHASVEIGDDVFTGPYVYITDQNHGYTDPDQPIGRQPPVNDPVSIGSGSWLGAGAIVLPGARIGRNVVVAAGSVVRGKIPDRVVVAGVPAKVVREYTDGEGWARPNTAPVSPMAP
jgi:acetyltransferase-like isoleucine patch superfamily enzyme